MSIKKPIVDYGGKQSEILATDTIPVSNLGTGTPSSSNYLRGDGNWATVSSTGTNAPVATRISRNTNQSIPTGTGWTDLVLSTSNYQSNGTFWTSGATTTIPETGLYFVTTEATFEGAGLLTMATINLQLEAVISGVTTIIGDDEKQLAIGSKGSLFVFAQRYFTVGDVIKNQVKHSDSGSLTLLSQGTHSPDIIITKVNGAQGASGTGGIVRLIANVSGGNITAGTTANTDYVYYVSDGSQITLPTAVGNTNRYTIIRTGISTVPIATTLSQTINGATSPLNLIMQYTSVDLMSNSSDWFIH